ncbi:hypothetical protein ACIQD3_03780 [Peribacillus loiseleuriae]|uniref:hypothetical protein n=1 Tax=Peribacillus loiseleuriae TaxID=1679170 RepID=UPI0038142D22
MEKDHSSRYYDDSNLRLKRKMNEEEVEISSTGYGLESVVKQAEEERKLLKRRDSSFCNL